MEKENDERLMPMWVWIAMFVFMPPVWIVMIVLRSLIVHPITTVSAIFIVIVLPTVYMLSIVSNPYISVKTVYTPTELHAYTTKHVKYGDRLPSGVVDERNITVQMRRNCSEPGFCARADDYNSGE
jgi:hypothetical protein